ncbi:hypothetical protein [Thiohalorhabdus sp.]|uniref:hypothetical protein n=1 Tax=Thiohalorhabdus sp. TaxID=3094134 RepID=UPI002FC30EBC
MTAVFGSAAQAGIVLVFGAVIILAVGTRLAGLADRLADRTGLGEAFVGAVSSGPAPPCRVLPLR